MYAVFSIGGRQVKAEPNEVVRVDFMESAKEGDKVVFDKILLVSDGGATRVGKPYLSGNVQATVVGHGRDKKIIVFKKKRRVDYHKKQGHRQDFTTVHIDAITAK